jgi:hypothetical protein
MTQSGHWLAAQRPAPELTSGPLGSIRSTRQRQLHESFHRGLRMLREAGAFPDVGKRAYSLDGGRQAMVDNRLKFWEKPKAVAMIKLATSWKPGVYYRFAVPGL